MSITLRVTVCKPGSMNTFVNTPEYGTSTTSSRMYDSFCAPSTIQVMDMLFVMSAHTSSSVHGTSVTMLMDALFVTFISMPLFRTGFSLSTENLNSLFAGYSTGHVTPYGESPVFVTQA